MQQCAQRSRQSHRVPLLLRLAGLAQVRVMHCEHTQLLGSHALHGRPPQLLPALCCHLHQRVRHQRC